MKYLEFETQMQRYGDLNEVAFFTALEFDHHRVITIHAQLKREKTGIQLSGLYPIRI